MKLWMTGLAVLALGGCSATPAKSSVSGTVQVAAAAQVRVPADGDPCTVRDGYDDVRAGSVVTVRDSKDEIVGTATLEPPTVTFNGGTPLPYGFQCRFTFLVPDVPRERGFYSVEVGSRGQVTFDEAKLFGPGPALTLG